MLAYAPVSGRIEAEIRFGDILGHALLWLLIIVVTLGIGLFFYPYSFAKFVINRTYLIANNGQKLKLQCDLDISSQIGHKIYVRLAQSDLANAQAAASPADHWGL